MALFEFEEGRLIPAQFGRPVANGLTPDIMESVRNQVLEIVSRPLFPITWRDMSRVADPTNEQPRLTALDASGQIVSVEVVEHLDSDTLIASLSRLADTAALSWTDLAGEYPGDIEGFKAGWMHFRDSMPPSPPSGPRLVMVVGSIDLQVRPALDVLASSGVEVHQMSLRQMSNGRAFLEVHAIGPRLYGHVPQVLLGRTGQVPQLPGLTETGSLPLGRRPASVPGQGTADEGGAAGEEGAVVGDEGGAAGAPQHAGPGEPESPDLDLVDQEYATPGGAGEPASAPGGASDGGVEGEARPETWSEVVPAWQGAEEGAAEADGSGSWGDEGDRDDQAAPGAGTDDAAALAERAADAAAHSSVDRTTDVDESDVEGIPVLARDAQGLASLAQIVGEDAPLVTRPSVEPAVEATLVESGLVRVPAGDFTDPSAALAASGLPDLDGWEELHLGDHLGPTLAESLDEVNREIVREYRRTSVPTHRH